MVSYDIKDSQLMSYAKSFVTSWKKVLDYLMFRGFEVTTIETYFAAKKFVNDKNHRMLNDYIQKNPQVDTVKLYRIADMIRDDSIRYVLFNYPAMAKFEIFLFKEKDKEVSEYFEEKTGYKYCSTTDMELINTLNHLKIIAPSDELEDKIDIEIDILKNIGGFARIGTRLSKEVQDRFEIHIKRTEIELNKVRSRMLADKYEYYRARRLNEVMSLSDRFFFNVEMYRNICEN